MNTTNEFAPAYLGLRQTTELSQSALPNAPVVPDAARDSAPARARRRIAHAARSIAGRTAPGQSGSPVPARG